jgi:toxin ParE1/3/4
MAKVYKRPSARQDIGEHFSYLAEHANLVVADRFLANLRESLSTLAGMPMIGAPIMLSHPELMEIRKWQVKGFDDILIFYIPMADGITVIRVLRASSNWWALFDIF